MNAFNALTQRGCPPDVAARLAPHLAAHDLGPEALPKALMPGFGWLNLIGLVEQFGLPIVLKIIQGLAPGAPLQSGLPMPPAPPESAPEPRPNS